MANRFASGKNSIAECDICGFRYKLKQLKRLVIKTKNVNVLACPTCWSPDHPQLLLGMFPVEDPQAVRDPRPDRSYAQSRDFQWSWNPVGRGPNTGVDLTPNVLAPVGAVGSVTVGVS